MVRITTIVFYNKDLLKMVLDKSEERKKQEEEELCKLREEKAKQEEVHMQWRVFMHLRAELAEMERKRKMAKEKD